MRAEGGAAVGVVLVVTRLRLGFARVALARELVREVQRELAVAVHEVEPRTVIHQVAVSASAVPVVFMNMWAIVCIPKANSDASECYSSLLYEYEYERTYTRSPSFNRK